jgi:hypothetical protein
MLNRKKQFVVFSFIFSVMLLAVIFPLVSGAQAGNGLPDRDPPPRGKNKDDDGSPVGAYIELAAPEFPGAWGVVQWQDSTGNWRDVEGWQGMLDERGGKRWWVAAKDFGAGPFRWVVGKTDALAAVSKPFNLPAVGASTVLITVQAK